jgi:hypothetical protein
MHLFYNAFMDWLRKMFFLLRRACAFLTKIRVRRAVVAAPLFLKVNKVPMPFIHGVNLPWLRYGGDFGANAWNPSGGTSQPENRENLRRVCLDIRQRGLHVVRWFLLCDGRAGIRFNASGTPLGPDPFLFADIDAALEVAATCGLKIVFVLLDFLWFGEADLVNGVQVRGRGHAIGSAYKQLALRRRVFKPILERYGSSPVILAWDIVNEPEWVTRGCDGASDTVLAYPTMRRFIKRMARMVHRYTGQLATVGLASAAGLSLARHCGLDFYQVHWYDRWEAKASLDRPVSAWDLDRPLLLGEFPTRNSSRRPDEIVVAAEKGGYCGALAWSFLGTDRASGIERSGEAT